MGKKIEEIIDKLVETIYKLETKKIEKGFLELIDDLEPYISEHPSEKWNEVLLNMQDTYMKKDYVRFSDILLYELKPLVERA